MTLRRDRPVFALDEARASRGLFHRVGLKVELRKKEGRWMQEQQGDFAVHHEILIHYKLFEVESLHHVSQV